MLTILEKRRQSKLIEVREIHDQICLVQRKEEGVLDGRKGWVETGGQEWAWRTCRLTREKSVFSVSLGKYDCKSPMGPKVPAWGPCIWSERQKWSAVNSCLGNWLKIKIFKGWRCFLMKVLGWPKSSITSYRKTQMNFLANPVIWKWCREEATMSSYELVPQN